MVNGELKSLVFSTMTIVPTQLCAPNRHGPAKAALTNQTHCLPVPSEVVLARPIHGLLRKRAAILAVEN
jgi:hypothetical protein